MADVGMSVKQRRSVAHSQCRVNIFDGSVRAGKTFGWLWIILNEVANYDGSGSIVIFGKNRDSIYRNVFEPFENVGVFAPFRPFVRYRQGAATASIFGRRVHVIGANDEGSESRIRGMTIGRAFGDEITVLNKSFFKQMLARMSVAGAKLWGTTNPDSPAHWLKTDYLNKIPGSMHFDEDTAPGDVLTSWSYWHFTMDDNPSLDDEYREALKREYTGLWYKRFILGLWVSAEGAIYPMWDEDRHTIRPDDIPPISRTLALGIDYGTTHPTAGMLLGVGTDDDNITRLYILDEWAPATGLTDAKLSADLKHKRDEWRQKWPEPEWTYTDPAAKSFHTQLWEDSHPDLAKADNAVLDGIRTVASLLDNDQLRVSKTCTELIRELPGYRWDDKAAKRGVEAPVKEQDDYCLVAGTMVETPHGEKPIETFRPGDEIVLPDGHAYPVEAAALTNRNAQVRTLHLSDGTTLTGTLNHPVLVGDEWVPLGDIQKGTVLKKWHRSKPLSTGESSSVVTQTQAVKRTSATSRQESATSSEVSTTCTVKSGVTTTDAKKSLPDTTFTTRTTTTATTGQKILNLSEAKIISPTTARNGSTTPSTPKSNAHSSNESAPLQRSGTRPTRGSSGTSKTQNAHGKNVNIAPKNAINAGEISRPETGSDEPGISSAPTSARALGDVTRDSTTFNEPANTAEQRSPSTSTERLEPALVHVQHASDGPVGQPVFNLTIAGKHQYLANGLVTHNCDALRYSVFSSRWEWASLLDRTLEPA